MITSLINASSPLVWDATMLAAAEVYAPNNQATIITPFILAGAMAPVTVAGVAAQTLAEALAGIAFTQLVRPGAPVVLGSFASSMSMQTGAPTFGTPEPALVLYTLAALARRLNLPFRSGGSLCASKLPDAQAAYESAATLLPTIMAGVNFVLHAAGWLEGGLAIGYEKFILDEDQLGMMAVFVKGVDLSANGQALDAIRENPPGQHFLGSAHTLANFEHAFYRSTTADNSSFEQWTEDGALDAAQRANRIWKQRLADYEPPPIDEAIDEELQDYIARRKAELPTSSPDRSPQTPRARPATEFAERATLVQAGSAAAHGPHVIRMRPQPALDRRARAPNPHDGSCGRRTCASSASARWPAGPTVRRRGVGERADSATIVESAARAWPSIAARIAARCSGVVPQHPPMMRAPASTARAA